MARAMVLRAIGSTVSRVSRRSVRRRGARRGGSALYLRARARGPERRTTAPPRARRRCSRPCGIRALRPRREGTRAGLPRSRSAPTMSSACSCGTISSSVPWSTSIGVDSRSTKLIGLRARKISAASGIRAEQRVLVAQLELVRVPVGRRLEVGDAEVRRARREHVGERQRADRRVAAGASARDEEPVRVGLAEARRGTGPR